MSGSSNLPQSFGPLSVGNVISAGLQIYRDRFKLYYSLAFRAYLWILVPVYGWAKFAAISGLISRLAFREIAGCPETVQEARRHVNPRLWTFLLAWFFVILILLGVFIGVRIVFTIVFGFLAALTQREPAFGILVIVLGIIALIAAIFGYIWLYSRLSLVELPIAIEDRSDAQAVINRSWTLTQGFVLRLQLIFFVAYLVSLPISFLLQIISKILQQLILTALFSQESAMFSWIKVVLFLGIAFAAGAVLIPFWQSIKAVIYYDLCSRKEGLDLQLRNLEDWE